MADYLGPKDSDHDFATQADFDPEGWTAVSTFYNSWVNFGSGYANAGYYKDPTGIVRLRGLVKSGTLSVRMFTLPSGYLPADYKIFPTPTGTGYGRIDVNTSGDVILIAGGNAYCSLDVIQFRAA